MDNPANFVKIATVQGLLVANVLKSHLESEGIPAILRYESVGNVMGITVDGIGKVHVMVPEHLADEAREIITPRETGEE